MQGREQSLKQANFSSLCLFSNGTGHLSVAFERSSTQQVGMSQQPSTAVERLGQGSRLGGTEIKVISERL